MTSAPAFTAVPVPPAIGRRPTTRRDLLRLRAALLVLTAAVFAGSLATFAEVQLTVRDANVNGAPAVLEVLAARSAIVQADAAAMTSFDSGQVQLSGPGAEYQSQLALATQSLTQVAEHSATGDSSQSLQLVEGLLVAYSGSIERADASFRQDERNPLGITDLWDGSRLLAGPGNILVQLDTLTRQKQRALTSQLSTGWMSTRAQLLWIVPIAALFGLLLLTQWYLARRFRRTVNLALLASTVLLLLVATATSTVFVSQSRADTAAAMLDQVVVEQWQVQNGGIAATRQHALGNVLRARGCAGADQGGCGDTVNTFLARLPAVAGAAPSTVERRPGGAKQVDVKPDFRR